MTHPHYLTRTECDALATPVNHGPFGRHTAAEVSGAIYTIAGPPAHWRDIPAQVDRIHVVAAGRIPELPLITTRAVKLNPDLWPDLEEG